VTGYQQFIKTQFLKTFANRQGMLEIGLESRSFGILQTKLPDLPPIRAKIWITIGDIWRARYRDPGSVGRLAACPTLTGGQRISV
jgi:hypothetical protein